jgi:ABC-type transport system substrate-binding protein
MRRRDLLLSAASLPAARAVAAPVPRTLRVAFDFAESGFDPVQVGDLSSITVCAHIFESPLTYDFLARPVLLKPLTAAALPEISDDHRHIVLTIRPGILFADDAAFGGKPRELTAADYVYSIKRFYDPRLKTEHLYQFENAKLLGLTELRRRATRDGTPFPYDVDVPGLRALDRYRFEIRLAEPAPRFVHVLASLQLAGALAREVVERYGDDVMAHPVGTGPFRLASWRRGSQIVLERNPRFREQRFDAVAPPDDAVAQATATRLRGQRLPLLDRVEIAVIDEQQPRWLAFVNGELDVLELPTQFGPVALPGGRLQPALARRGVRARSQVGADVSHTFFNFADPMVGGYSPAQVALRRAVAIALDQATEIRQVRGGQAVAAQSMMVPHTYGFDASLVADAGRADAARAKALLDLYGWRDRDGDGWRERPDGAPLRLRLASTADQRARRLNELWRSRMQAIGVRIDFEVAPFGELIKRSLAGKLMMWGFAWTAGTPDGEHFLGLAYGPNADQSNDARFALPAYDALFERQRVLADGPERLALMRQLTLLQLAYVPYIPHTHTILTDLTQPHVHGYLRHPFSRDCWRTVEVEAARA